MSHISKGLTIMFFFIVVKLPFNSLAQIDRTLIDQLLFEKYDLYKEEAIKYRRLKHKDLLPLIQKLPFNKKVIGKSFEGRDIYQLTLGNGPIVALLWTQMHGDEPTATMAIMDILNWFAADDEFNELREEILTNMTLHIIPMLNPDGAERYIRRTSIGIDMNRDALRLQNPESRILKQLQDELKPEISYNLHDQSTRYSVGMTPKQATISFLASSYDYERSWNDSRIRAAQLICSMNETLQKFIPGHVGKYKDDHEPRAFGDNIAKWGSSLILIESGGFKDDTEKQFVRKLNFIAIISSFIAMVEGSFTRYTIEDYHEIPQNDNYLFDLLIRNVIFEENGIPITKDIGININEVTSDDYVSFTLDSRVVDLGDLSIFYGIEELDAQGMKVSNLSNFNDLAKKFKYTEVSKKLPELNSKDNFVLVKDGYPVWVVSNGKLHKVN